MFFSVYGRPRTFLTHPTPSIDLPPWSYPTMEKKFCDFWVATSFLSSKALLLKKSTFFVVVVIFTPQIFEKKSTKRRKGLCLLLFDSSTLWKGPKSKNSWAKLNVFSALPQTFSILSSNLMKKHFNPQFFPCYKQNKQ